jgi:hypothetical protein
MPFVLHPTWWAPSWWHLYLVRLFPFGRSFRLFLQHSSSDFSFLIISFEVFLQWYMWGRVWKTNNSSILPQQQGAHCLLRRYLLALAAPAGNKSGKLSNSAAKTAVHFAPAGAAWTHASSCAGLRPNRGKHGQRIEVGHKIVVPSRAQSSSLWTDGPAGPAASVLLGPGPYTSRTMGLF